MDAADIADRVIQENMEQTLQAHAKRAAAGIGDGLVPHCEECGHLIPEQRRAAIPNCRLCVHCQSLAEARQKNHSN